ncbi:50S ribosomal protein L35 [Candidatus Marinamargulisbacteria bacterium SCGC AG-343-D04]|nr:50S ribosomal protein L35 [Candidatus Marinamargulisbacteria bacterium SCGC AG-343-D04]
MKKTKKYKIKTKKAASKRFTITGSGKVRRKKAGKRHLLEHKSPDTIRAGRNKAGISKSDITKVRAMLPGVTIKE